ncbi:MAG: hypothetical protein LBF87_06585 [Treponema sp.]|nr:hypothetical protein [Treponema sp.]
MKMFMKRSVCILALMGLCASLSAIDFQKRKDLGLSGFLIFANTNIEPVEEDIDTSEKPVEFDADLSSGTILPLIDAGFYGQMNIGQSLHLGLGFRVASLILATVTWPTVYTELDLWRFSLNMRLGGGFFAGLVGFYPFFLTGDALIPEVSLWFRFSRSRFGVGALSLLSVSSLNAEFFKGFSKDTIKNNRVSLYISYIWSLK